MNQENPETKTAALAATKLSLEIEQLQQEVAALKRPPPSFWQRLLDQWQGTVITAILGLFAAFPNLLADKVKGSVDRIEQRSAQFQKISGEWSAFMAAVERVVDLHQDNAAGKDALDRLSKEYTTAFDAVRQRGHANKAVIARLWGAKAAEQYQALLAEARQVDAAVHRFRLEDDKVLAGKAEAADAQALAPAVAQLSPAGKKLAEDVAAFLRTLE